MGKIARNGNMYGGGNLTYTTEEVTKVTHGDWNINDSSNEHYIENRPFYETDVVIPSYTYEDLVEYVTPDPFVPIVEGQSYKVIYDGQEYTCEAKTATMISIRGGLGLGNLGLLNDYNGTGGEEYPFAIGYDYSEGDYYHFLCNDGSEHTIEVRSIGEENKTIKQIDKKFIPEVIPHVDGAGYHNSIYRGKYLGTAVTDAQWAAIKAGTFEDLYIGDYWTINGVNYYIAAFDYYLDSYSDTSEKNYVDCHHVTIVPDSTMLGYTGKFSNYNEMYGYGQSSIRTAINDEETAGSPIYNFNLAFGDQNILKRASYFVSSTALTTSSYPGRSLYEDKVRLLSEINLYGRYVQGYSSWRYYSDHSSSGTYYYSNFKSSERGQYPLFLLNPGVISASCINGSLRDIVSIGYVQFDSYVIFAANNGHIPVISAGPDEKKLILGFEIYQP